MATILLHNTERSRDRDLPWKELWKRNVLVLVDLVGILQYKTVFLNQEYQGM
jgi:hypothetical protein